MVRERLAGAVYPPDTRKILAHWVLFTLVSLWNSHCPALYFISHLLSLSHAQDCLDLYHEAFPRDKWTSKLPVYSVYIIELVQTILVTHDSMDIFGFGFGDIEAATAIHFDWLTVPMMSGVGELFFVLFPKINDD